MTDRKLPVIPVGFEAKYSGGRWSLEHRDSGFQLNKDSLSVYRDAVDWVERANNIPRSQTADEVVRCRECRHWESKSVPTRCTEGVGGLKITNDDGSSYCSYGERKARGE